MESESTSVTAQGLCCAVLVHGDKPYQCRLVSDHCGLHAYDPAPAVREEPMLDSPNFVPAQLQDFAARGYERKGRGIVHIAKGITHAEGEACEMCAEVPAQPVAEPNVTLELYKYWHGNNVRLIERLEARLSKIEKAAREVVEDWNRTHPTRGLVSGSVPERLIVALAAALAVEPEPKKEGA